MIAHRTRYPNWQYSLGIACIAILPLALYWVFREFFAEYGLWLFYDHIEVLYYVSGIEIAQGYAPTNVDNPGTPAQLLAALLVSVIGFDPASYSLYVRLARTLLLVLTFLSVFVLFFGTQKWFDWRLQVASIWCFFSFSVGLSYLRVFGPEPFYFIVGVLAIYALFRATNSSQGPKNWRFFIFGLCVGALLTVKFTFLAWLPGAFLVAFFAADKRFSIQTIGYMACLSIGTILGFGVITSIIWESYPYMFDWVLGNMTRDGAYGDGETTLPSFAGAVSNWKTFVLSNKTWLASFALIFVLSALSYRNKDKDKRKSHRLIILFVVTSCIFTILFISRAYQHRYMLPIGLCGIAAMFTLDAMNRSKVIYTALLVGFFLLLIRSMYLDYANHQYRVMASQQLLVDLHAAIEDSARQKKIPDPTIVYGWRIPHPALSLRQHHVKGDYLESVDKLYTNSGHYTPWLPGNSFRLANGLESWDYAILRSKYLSGLDVGDFEVIHRNGEYSVIESKK